MNEHVQLMIDWIETRLKDIFSLDELANDMGYSPYYCSFKFHQTTGVSIRRYILLRRLFMSTQDLADGKKIIDIALDYNYSSQEAYSRAFKSVFGISPKQFTQQQLPVQSFMKLSIQRNEEDLILRARKAEVLKLQDKQRELFDTDVLNILNGQIMYEEFREQKLMGNSDYAPFNEAMCVHAATSDIFNEQFITVRAEGHHSSVEGYTKKVIEPLRNLCQKNYSYIVLWFGEDMFCQINLLTLLAYLEQIDYKGTVFLNNFREDEFKVNQTELTLGEYNHIYQQVVVNHQRPSFKSFTPIPVMYQAINLYLEMLEEENPVTKYIQQHTNVPTTELLPQLFRLFPNIGYGDLQYIELINKVIKSDN
ncbi:AraC family transcriptional regulator [Paenibacillus turicensis]|uniref:helix-turn-helix transcriptional regulator n=1 Tax=Paenibacillus turicensis TaxID=160487 RepID=UPI003D296205